MASIRFYVGIDISKETLDITILNESVLIEHEKISNTVKEIAGWLKNAASKHGAKRSNTLFCMESMGLYGAYLQKQLIRIKAKFWIESPLQIKRSLGLQRGKNDKVDSLRIAQYCYVNRHNFTQYEKPRSEIEQLRLLTGLRNRIISSHNKLSVSIKESKNYLKKNNAQTITAFCKNSLTSLKQDKITIENTMLEVIKSDERLNKLYKILTSIQCVGKITAIQLLVVTNEFKKFDSPRKFACYCGVAPFEHTSGTSTKGKTRVSRLANIKMKTTLHLSAIVAVKCKGELHDYFKRKVAEGKSKMSVINAIRNKLIHRIFACIREERLYQKTWKPAAVKKEAF